MDKDATKLLLLRVLAGETPCCNLLEMLIKQHEEKEAETETQKEKEKEKKGQQTLQFE